MNIVIDATKADLFSMPDDAMAGMFRILHCAAIARTDEHDFVNGECVDCGCGQ